MLCPACQEPCCVPLVGLAGTQQQVGLNTLVDPSAAPFAICPTNETKKAAVNKNVRSLGITSKGANLEQGVGLRGGF